tara:strand:- start:284 stop:739 length:456 start_codon:yes stop_codon:yes gene_type:complete
MAHFAKLGLDNVVTAVLYMDTITTMTRGGIEREDIGVAHLIKHHGHENWKKCSYNTSHGVHKEGGTPFRANYPGIGWYYNSEHDIFHPAQTYASHVLNTTTGMWDPPFAAPTLTDAEVAAGNYYEWDESAYQADNTAGWVLQTNTEPQPSE